MPMITFVNLDTKWPTGSSWGEQIGVPQTRARHFTVGLKDSTAKISFDHFSKPTVSEARSIGWAINDLQGQPAPSDAMFYRTPNATPVNQRRMDYLIDNDKHDLPEQRTPSLPAIL